MQIRANQRISLFNLNAGNITYFYIVLFQLQNPHGTLHRVSSFLLPFIFKSNNDQISTTPLTLSFTIIKFHAMNEPIWPTNCSPSVLFIVTSDLRTVLSQTSIKSDIYNQNQTINFMSKEYYLSLPCTIASESIESKNLQRLRSEETIYFFLKNHSAWMNVRFFSKHFSYIYAFI